MDASMLQDSPVPSTENISEDKIADDDFCESMKLYGRTDPAVGSKRAFETLSDGTMTPSGDELCGFGWRWRSDRTVDENYMDLAYRLTRNSYCREGHMGCVIVRVPKSLGSEKRSDGSETDIVVRTVNTALNQRFSSECHAEANAVCACAAKGVSIRWSTCYVTKTPCKSCFKLLTMSGISRIVCPGNPVSNDVQAVVRRLRIEWVRLPLSKQEEDERREEASRYQNMRMVKYLRELKKKNRRDNRKKKERAREERQSERGKEASDPKKRKKTQSLLSNDRTCLEETKPTNG